MTARLHAFVCGDVQGVSFRWFVAKEAHRFDLTGWVRNRRDGRVEVLAEGSRDLLDALVEKLRRGPSPAHVENVDLSWEEKTGEFPDFKIEATV